MSAQIVILTGPDEGQTFFIEPGRKFQVGRSHTTDTCLTDGTVSRIHCIIDHDGTKALLTNNSDKGTYLNGLSVESNELHHGDIVQIGGTQFRFQLLALENATTLLQPATE